MKSHDPENPESFLSKRRVGLAGAAAVIGCAACCAMPIVAAATLGGGALATLAFLAMPGMELIVGASVFITSLLVMAVRYRRRTTRSAACCTVDSGCTRRPSASAAPSCDATRVRS